jgi:uncharacterized membrane protein (UPF0182 family)
MPGGPPGAGSAGGAPRRPVVSSRRRGRALLPTLLILGALLIAFSIFTGFYTDLLWYQSVGYTKVFTGTLRAKSLLFFLFGILFAGAVSANFVIAYRTRPTYQALIPGQAELDRYRTALDPYKRIVVLAIAVLLGLIAGSSASGQWRTYLQWRHGASFGTKDLQFGKDISFFTFDLPWYRFVVSFLFATVVVGLIAAAVTHYLYGGLRLQPLLGERATPAARVHLSVLLGVFVLLKAVAYWLDRYSLAVKESHIGRADFSGLAYTDVNAVLLGRTILAIISIICAGLFFANIVRRTWLLPGVGVGALLVSALLIGGIYPAIVQRFEVKPSERTKEAPYIRKNINATRAAYGINDVQISDYAATTKASADQLRADSDTTASIRLLDPAIVSPTYKNLQQIRAYYDFQDDLDVDRYTIQGQKRDVVVAARELDLAGLPDAQRNWINDHTVYTHGFGFVAALGNTTANGGRPSFVSSNIPPVGDLGSFQPRIYFGEESPSYSIVGAPSGATKQELDFPTDTGSGGQSNNTYSGGGGVAVGSLWRKLIFASKYQESNILLSNQINPKSRILYDRDPKTRVEKVAPWLTLDGDPYPTIVDNKMVWIVDGYTTSNGYPYSTRRTLEDVTADSRSTAQTALVTPVKRINYIRNSVKATVDAYTGKVTLYTWDSNDPVLKTWKNAFKGTVLPKSAISNELMQHFRYPEDLFKVQRDLLASYHVGNPGNFYSGSDFWRVPVDPTQGNAKLQPPYYLTLRMPGQDASTFSLTSTYVPTGDRNNLSAFIAVSSDPGPDYGKFRVLQLPRSVQINGPSQVQNQFISDDVVAEQLNILKRGTQVRNGNLLTLPVGGGLLYVEPVYVQAEDTTSYPLLRKVLVSFGDKVAFEDTLQDSLDAVFSGTSGAVTGGSGTGGGGSGGGTGGGGGAGAATNNPALAAALADAQQALRASQAALTKGDFAAYGTAQKALQDAINRALAAEAAAAPSPSGSASPSASPSSTPKPSASGSSSAAASGG